LIKGGQTIHWPKEDRQYIDQKKQDTNTNNDVQNTIKETNDRTTGTPLQTGCELMCSGRVCGAHRVPLITGKSTERLFALTMTK
jgi:hypothetical protein